MDRENNTFGTILLKAIDHLVYPVWILDPNDKIVYMNEIMLETFGDLIGHSSHIIYDNGTDICDPVPVLHEDKNGIRETDIADVTYRIVTGVVQEEEGLYSLEVFNDISKTKMLQEQIMSGYTKLTNETRLAKRIQNRILPIDDVYADSMDICSVYLPADDLGGDIFDVVELNEDETLLYICDVSGHGIQASLLTMYVRENVRSLKDVATKGLDVLIDEMIQSFIELDIDVMMYYTILFCKYNKKTKDMCIANAGHNCYPLVLRGNGRVEEVPVQGMPITKISDSSEYEEEVISMNSGDRLILYTDGIIEEFSVTEKKAFGSEGVRRIAEANHLLSGKQLAEKIVSEAAKYMLINAKDDRTIVIADIL